MSIRTKTLLIVGLTLLSLIAILYAFSQAILLQGYINLEQETVTRNVQRALNATQEEIAFLRRTSHDYAHWDDTYNYIQGLDESYIETNAFEGVLRNYDLNFILFVNEAGEVVYSHAFDLDTQETVPISESLVAMVRHNDALIYPIDENGNLLADGLSGIVMLPDAGMILSAAPIFPSVVEGEPSGALIWGRFINESLVTRMGEQTELSLEIQPVRADETDPHFVEVLPMLVNLPIVVQARGDDVIDGYALLRDIHNQPALILEAEIQRSIYQQGQNSLSYFLISLVMVGIISAVVIALLLEKGVLSRLAYLNNHVSQIQTSGDISARIAMGGSDELTNLATNVNAMLESLQAQEKIKLARDNALEAARLKAEILANVSHDARTPLTVIQLRTELLIQGIYGALTDKQRNILSTIQTSAFQLLGFVNNLLEGAQLEAGHLRLRISEMEPAKLLDVVETTLSPLAAKKNLTLKTELSEDVPLKLLGDQSRLDQILTNLVSNAIKFTERGSVTARIYRVDHEHWAMAVEDTGKGISPEQQEQIFSPFWQVDGSTTRAANSGVGLGLAIVRQLADLMDGQVSVKSKPGEGSVFTIILPILVPVMGEENAAEAVRIGD